MTDILLHTINNIAAGSGKHVADEVSVFTENDPYGALMAIIGMGIVFLILLLLFIVFNNTPKLYTAEFKEKIKTLFSRNADKDEGSDLIPKVEIKREDMSGEVNAAIAAAIHLYRSELHDYEDTVLTINKVSRTYSPWSSKIYGLRPAFRK
jgi:sodium pump decarboxylase gamma subunit